MKHLSHEIILMAGDSWPAGTWKKDIDYPVGPGIASNFLDLAYQVRNLAKPGGSNLESIDRIKDYLACNPHEISNIKFILFWQTEFFREIWYYRKSNIWPSIEKELKKGYTKMKSEWIYRPYYRLTEISQRYNIPVYVLGGCSDTVYYEDFEKDFPGVKIACQSLTNMLINQHDRTEQPVFCLFLPVWIEEGDFLNLAKKHCDTEDLQNLSDDMELARDRVKDFEKHPEFFYPDGSHPNTHAHAVIFEFLIEHIQELKNETS